MSRFVALVLALFMPGLPLAQAAGIAAKPACAMHRIETKRLPCHEMQSSQSPARVAQHDCCKGEMRFARGLCTCGHGNEASGLSREPSLAPKRVRFALVLAEAPLVERAAKTPARLADAPDPRPPSAGS